MVKRRSPDNDRRPAEFLRGEPGRNGLDGVPGLDGAPGLDGIPGADGRNGRDGHDGRDGRDGKDGQPGEPGPIGPVGPSGEPGRRGKQGPPGKAGSAGLPGVCAYQAKFDCSLEGNRSALQALLIAPKMIGDEEADNELEGERQVSVNEGDNIQLACKASGSPEPSYVWRRAERRSTILLDATTNTRSSSVASSQLPLMDVDRLQMGVYQCVASNGVPPEASKRINLDVNYRPTIRLYPSVELHRVELGSSLAIECIVEANPAAFAYWTLNSNSIMSVAPPSSPIAGQVSKDSDWRAKKYLITESAGQLIFGAYYTILTLNISNIGADDLGLYKCVGKNLLGQSAGSFLLEQVAGRQQTAKLHHHKLSREDETIRDAILKGISNGRVENLDHSVGWPNSMLERPTNNKYLVFGHRRSVKSTTSLNSSTLNVSLLELAKPTTTTLLEESQQVAGKQSKWQSGEREELELCKLEESTSRESLKQQQRRKSGALLLDQVGKPVYMGNIADNKLDWWSVDAKLRYQDKSEQQSSYFASSANNSEILLEYSSLADLLRDQQNHHQHLDSANTMKQPKHLRKLKHLMYGNSRLIFDDLFVYVTLNSSATHPSERLLSDLRVVALNLTDGTFRYLDVAGKLASLSNQPLELGPERGSSERLELMADENGLWMVLPSVEWNRKGNTLDGRDRRVHAIKFSYGRQPDQLEIDFHVSMQLDWTMIDQTFIIDGVLYGIKDRHLYSSKLQFAYDLYRCKLLPTEYLNEPHRTFTSNFGNTQMIRYNPNEPKRLYIIDNANLLWCPLKLIKMNPDDIWHQQTDNNNNNNNSSSSTS